MRESQENQTTQDPQAPVYSIGTVARLLGVSVFTLRLYEREGLILAEKSESNQRRYSFNDIERLKCIRRAITEQKFGIAGIKTIFSMIPCWNIVHCSEDDRKNCQAYLGHTGPCWSLKHLNNTCETRTCRDCAVYRDFADCVKVKQSIVNISPTP